MSFSRLAEYLSGLPASVPCPQCGDPRFTLEGTARRCWACGHTWNQSTTLGRAVDSPDLEGSPRRPGPPFGVEDERGALHRPVASASAGVLVQTGILTREGTTLPCDPSSPVEVCRAALGAALRQVWVGPASVAQLGLPPSFEVPRERDRDRFRYGVSHHWTDALVADGWQLSTDPGGFAPWVGMGKDGAWLDLVLPGWDPANPFAAARTPRELLYALAAFAEALGLRYRRSPQSTGLALLRDTHRRSGWPEAILPPPTLEVAQWEAPGSWIRDLPSDGWLHAYDINGMYLAACSTISLGYESPTHLGPGLPPLRAGYYRARVFLSPVPDGLPFPADGEPRWYPEPAIRLFLDLKARITVDESWTFPRQGRWLAPWYARLRDARAALAGPMRPGGHLALAALKATYTRTLGRLAGSWLGTGDETFRPDWRDSIIARARANLFRHLAALPAPPVAQDADLVVFASADPDPQRVAGSLGLELSSQLGKWKVAGSLAAPDVTHVSTHQSGSARLSALLTAMRS